MDRTETVVKREPVTFTSLLTAAVIATLNVMAIIFDWDDTILAAMNIAAAGWIAVVGYYVRSRVTPVR